MISIHLKHKIAKNKKKTYKNLVFRAKKRHFLTFFAVYSKHDIRVTTFFKSLITPPKMRLSTKSFREMKDKEFRTKTTEPKF